MGHGDVLEKGRGHGSEGNHVRGCCIGGKIAHPRHNMLLESPSCELSVRLLLAKLKFNHSFQLTLTN
jgi:hypothetical protein